MNEFEPLPDELAQALRAAASRRRGLGGVVHFLSTTTSTNDVAARLAEQGAAEGTVVVARAQTAGRGRLGRSWFSPADAGLYVSAIFRNKAAAPLLTLAAGVALADGIRAATGLTVAIKWPNDVVVRAGSATRQRQKLAGILAEASTVADEIQFVVLGFGINVREAAYPPEIAQRATSLEAELGRPADVGRLLAETLAALNERVTQLETGNRDGILNRWRALACLRGVRVRCDAPGSVWSGMAEGIDDTGALLVRVGDTVERIVSGDVSFEI